MHRQRDLARLALGLANVAGEQVHDAVYHRVRPVRRQRLVELQNGIVQTATAHQRRRRRAVDERA
jgi:hypothetical protein